MRQRLFLFITVIAIVGLLIALNAVSYVKVEQRSESETSPARSTFNAGPTGTRAFFDFLQESGQPVLRWRDSPSTLISSAVPKPATMIVVGPASTPFSKSDSVDLLRWVAGGGRLVIIDRHPDRSLLPPSGQWQVNSYTSSFPSFDVDPNNLEQMTSGITPLSPSQPAVFARDVSTVLPSRFAGTITIASTSTKNESPTPNTDPNAGSGESGHNASDDDSEQDGFFQNESLEKAPGSPAPVVNFATVDGGSLLIDYPHGKGRIVLLSDPFIVANNGINRADNLQLALNLVQNGGGLIAFDEFHHGHAATHNALIQYFEGTPVMALFGQFALLTLAIVWSRARRFARPLPLPSVDRRSALEFVASMAELQQRARAHDLAIENIYGRVRRVLVRYAGLNNNSPRTAIAARVATRSGMNQDQIESLMRECEETVNGVPTAGKEVLRMAKRLREIENRLGLGARARDVKQAAERSSL